MPELKGTCFLCKKNVYQMDKRYQSDKGNYCHMNCWQSFNAWKIQKECGGVNLTNRSDSKTISGSPHRENQHGLLDCTPYLAKHCPSALRWVQCNGNQLDHVTMDIRNIIRTATRSEMIVSKSEVVDAQVLHQGSRFTIFRAWHTTKQSTVAVKRVAKDEMWSRTVLLELKAIIGLIHPRVVRFEGLLFHYPESATESGQVDLLFEFCENGNLFTKLHQTRSLLPKDRARVACQVAEGMIYLHDKNILHRNLNCTSIVFANNMAAKICDFHCARVLGSDGCIRPTAIIGCPSYMSPEQLAGSVLTLKSDVWAIGVIVWELISMKIPWQEIITTHVEGFEAMSFHLAQGRRLPKIDVLNYSGFPHSFLASIQLLLDQCFQRDPAARPTMRDFLTKIQDVSRHSFPDVDF
mmetsp:Transcript_63349/g.169388  ORF Transcript_63349/g.169388 Transcript_63349/m.169388 type:complete len:408 (+) Transcript_63349:3104-4327(+)